jgi:hypothetical protein
MGRLFENLAPAMAWIQTLGQPEIGEGLQHLIPLLDDMATLAQQLEIPDPTGDVRNVIERGQDPTANAGALIMVLRLTFDRLTDTVRGQMPPGAAEFGKPGDPVLCSVTRESVNRFGTPSKRSVAKR